MGAGMNLSNPPELADGGYWYVLPVVIDPVLGGKTAGDVAGSGWCAWYSGNWVAIRCPSPVTGLKTESISVSEVVSGSKPYGRIRGA